MEMVMGVDVVLLYRLGAAPAPPFPCLRCGTKGGTQHEVTWRIDTEALRRCYGCYDGDEQAQALARVYLEEAQRQARGEWHVYEMYRLCRRCVIAGENGEATDEFLEEAEKAGADVAVW